MTDLEHAPSLIRAFIAPGRRERYLKLLASARGRVKLRRALAHLPDLDPRYVREIPASEQSATGIATLLRAHGAPAECELIAEDSALDGRRLPLDAALAAVVGRGMGALISCLPGRLGFYEGESTGERYLLERDY